MFKTIPKGVIAGGIAALIALIVLLAIGGASPVFLIVFLNVFLISFGFSVYYQARREAFIKDERTNRIAAASFMRSWWATFIVMNVMIWVEIFRPGTLSVKLVLYILLLGMLWSALAFKWWLNRRGDVE